MLDLRLGRGRRERPYAFVYNTSTPDVSAHSPNSRLMLSPLCVRRMLSAIVGLTSIVTSFLHSASCCVCGMVFVTCKRGPGEHAVRS